MKQKMKQTRFGKLLALLLAAVLLCSTFSLTASALPVQIYDDTVPLTLLVELDAGALLNHSAAKRFGSSAFYSSKAFSALSDKIASQQASALTAIRRLLPSTSLLATYNAVFNGFALTGTRADAERLKKLSGIKNVYVSGTHKLISPASADSGVSFTDASTKLDAIRSLGYTGKGTAIAVLDTSLEVNHEVFRLSSSDGVKYTKDAMLNLLTSKSFGYGKLKAGRMYKSEKVPFAYDYAGNDSNVADSTQAHGTHVSGIAVGNSASLKGVAPEAQLLFFKVFRGETAADVDILKGLDDAVKFDVSAINLSLGADCQMVNSEDSLPYEPIFATAKAAGIPVFCATGNAWRGLENYISPEDIDYSTAGMPVLAASATGVCAADATTEIPRSSWFSAYALSDSLQCGADITAPGSDILSSVPGGQYDIFSGTSMATPYLSGAAALLGQYLRDTYPDLTVAAREKLLENLTMSAASVLRDPNGIPYSPAVQGAGLLDFQATLQASAVLYGPEGDTKINLYDRLETEFSFPVTVENFTDRPVTYRNLSVETMTDRAELMDVVDEDGVVLKEQAGPFIGSQQRLLSEFTVSSGDTLTVPAHTTQTFTVTVSLDETQLRQIREDFRNGFYVEGFLLLSDDALPTLSIPFIGFSGDWTDAPFLSAFDYQTGEGYSYLHSDIGISGVNYFDKSIRNADWVSFSPNSDALADSCEIFLAPLRGSKSLSLSLKSSNGSVLWEKTLPYCAKYTPLEISDNLYYNNKVLPDGKYVFTATGVLDYPGAGEHPQTVRFPFTVDTKKPVVTRQTLLYRDGKKILRVTATDSLAVQGGRLSGNTLSTLSIKQEAAAVDGCMEFDITNLPLSDFTLTVYDYAFNSIELKEASQEIHSSVSCLLPDTVHAILQLFQTLFAAL